MNRHLDSESTWPMWATVFPLILILIGCGGGPATTPPPPPATHAKFLYVTGNSQIFSFPVDSTNGTLGPALTMPGPGRDVLGTTPTMVADPEGEFLFALDNQSQAINTYSIDPGTGAASQVSSLILPVSGFAFPRTLTIAPSGKFIFAATLSEIFGFSVSSTGTLSPIHGLLFVTMDALAGNAVAPSGKYLYSGATGPSNIDVVTLLHC